ncbi:MAG: 50S ribosomal protein L6 [Candidatus Terrybacteria bacterium RIFCSPLOWO2_02_42_20]|uniref:50S ribosomal protein L6 n=2 Tax=Candidatus Terryibacteriota TaxID=1817920 RepID=A0A1G2PP30_9BACT|nr:MAG: 50S ribosomal protein L6 [Candidatus Terrybacteria bacterium RIFCSPHIGHO2_02_41_19]OHA54302.1 MAG: 50S ribosomal protein L6 [Candidatus Terrybacteria bacterium RIFCSPLOWO2_02_42_20]
MSHIGKKGIQIPDNVDVKLNGNILNVKGPLGEMTRFIPNDVEIKIADKIVTVVLRKGAPNKAVWGTFASHISNMIKGVITGFEKKLIIEGIGFKAQLEGNKLSLNIGLSHPVKIEIPKGVKVLIEKSLITISGYDKETIGQFSADVRAFKKPEPYKGTGIRYEKEIIRRKAGKKAATAAT